MILVDTSVWVDHFRRGNADLEALLEDGEVLSHPFVIGELACGRLRNRGEILTLLQSLPCAPLVEHDEALAFIEAHALMGTGLGWVDLHLLASTMLAHTTLWTLDRALLSAAKRLGAIS